MTACTPAPFATRRQALKLCGSVTPSSTTAGAALADCPENHPAENGLAAAAVTRHNIVIEAARQTRSRALSGLYRGNFCSSCKRCRSKRGHPAAMDRTISPARLAARFEMHTHGVKAAKPCRGLRKWPTRSFVVHIKKDGAFLVKRRNCIEPIKAARGGCEAANRAESRALDRRFAVLLKFAPLRLQFALNIICDCR